jgi:hypothetical protein
VSPIVLGPAPSAAAAPAAIGGADPAPRVSVIIPTYNYGQFVGAAIHSALEQQGVLSEVVVVDDGSTDNTPEVVARLPQARYLRQTNLGIAAALNRGAAVVRGEFLCFLGADDILVPGAFHQHLACLDAHPDADAVVGTWTYMDASGAPLPQFGRIPPGPLTARQIVLDVGQPATPGAALIRRATFERLGGFDPSVSPAEDLDLWIRLAAAGGCIVGADHPAIRIRVHGHNASAQADVMARQIGTVYDRFADTQPDGREVRARARFYAGLALAAAKRAAGDSARWRALLLDPSVETSPAWESPDGFVRLGYLLLPHGRRAHEELLARSSEIAAVLNDALAVLATGPSHSQRRAAAGWLAVAQIHLGARERRPARRALGTAAAADPTIFWTKTGAATLVRAVAPEATVSSGRRLKRVWRTFRGASRA